jgi:hypothetical protein
MVNSTTGSTSLIAAFAVFVAFAAFVVFLIRETDAADVRWTRLACLFTSVEAIAFGAAWAFFGSSIQRARAENAEQGREAIAIAYRHAELARRLFP